jgi:guanyl-specific ribonuclease Sa
MKKILLCLFLFTSLSFYSQVANEVHCAGGTTFNLTNHNSLLIGNLNPAETTVSYHLTAADASNGVNAISNPSNFIVPQIQINLLASQTIYARINHLGNITTNYFSLIVNPIFLVAARIEPINCYSNGTIMLDVFGGQAPFTCNINNTYYSTSDSNTTNFSYFPTGNMSTITFSNLVAGNYNIILRDAIGCDAFGSWTIEPSSIIPLNTPTATVINATCKGSNNGAININATGGKSPFSYSIDNGVTYVSNSIFTNLAAGNYTVYVKDASDCIKITNASVTEPNLLQMSAAITKPIDCISNASVTVTATGGTAPYTYSKDGITFVQSNVFDNLVAGTYALYVKDVNSCINSSNSLTISPLLPLSISSTALNVTCNGNGDGIITINTSGGKAPFYYSIDNGVTFVSSNVFKNLVAGTYNITVKDTSNCISSIIATVVEPTLLSTTAALTKPIDCISNASVTVTGTGGTAPYTYSKDGITFVQSNVFDNLVTGTYSTYVKDYNGCISSSNTITISPITPLSISSTVANITCNGNSDGTITINATGGKAPLHYSIDNGVTFVSSNIFKNLVAGTYNITVKDASNCTSSMIATVVEPVPLSATTAITKTIDCISNATATVTATGGTAPHTYSKDGITFVTSNVFDNLVAGNYTVFVKDVNGCTNQSNQFILHFVPLTATFAKTEVLCKGNSDGSITVNANGGQGPYTYSLDNGPYINGNSSMTFTNLNAGSHNIIIVDVNGCFATNQVVISEPVSALMTVTTVKNQSITINATGGAGNYRYAISPNLDKFSTNNVFSELTPGTYVVNTSDVNGCYITMNAVVDPPAPLINGQIKLTLEFKPGQTLADLIIDGQNIKWYINQNPLAGKTSKTSEVPLPLSTVIVDGTTYYASQTINGIESTERLAVTVKSATLGTTDLVIKDFTYYPNPVKNIFTISNTSIIDEISLISIKGETLLTKKINSLHHEFDLSNFSKGVYFLKVKAEGTEKTVKLIKE